MVQGLKDYFRGWIDHPHLGRRIVIAVISTMMMGVCIFCFEWLAVGTDPYSCVCIAISHILHIDLQIVQPIVQGIALLAVIAVARDMFGFGSLCNIFLVGITHDFILKNIFHGVHPQTPDTPAQILLFIPVAAVFLLSVSSYVAADLGTSPYDAAPIIIQRKLSRKYPKMPRMIVRMAWDLFFTLLGLLLAGPFGAVTVACVLFLGPLIAWLSNFMRRFIS